MLASEQTADRLERLKQTQLLLVNNWYPEHGDPQGCAHLVTQLRTLGAQIDEWTPAPFPTVLWGERERGQLEHIANWIEVHTGRSCPRSQRALANDTVKNAILRGFDVEPTTDPQIQACFERWSVTWRGFRGAELPWISTRRVPTRVVGRVLTAGENLRARLDNQFVRGTVENVAPSLGHLWDRQIFGFRLFGQPGSQTVEVFRSTRDRGVLPGIELATLGSCRGAIWIEDGPVWQLYKVWM